MLCGSICCKEIEMSIPVEFRAKPVRRLVFNGLCMPKRTLMVALPEGTVGEREYSVALEIVDLHPRDCPICHSPTELARDGFQHYVKCTNETCNTIGPRRPGDMSATAAWNGEDD